MENTTLHTRVTKVEVYFFPRFMSACAMLSHLELCCKFIRLSLQESGAGGRRQWELPGQLPHGPSSASAEVCMARQRVKLDRRFTLYHQGEKLT